MKNLIVFAVLLVSGCISNSPPKCYATMVVQKQRIDVPIFAFQDSVGREMLAGAPLNGWVSKSQFVDVSQCQTPKASL